jgi:serine-type D-Ala-D-Ala carboxypeptidase (penicillin-binding protein 5/6)
MAPEVLRCFNHSVSAPVYGVVQARRAARLRPRLAAPSLLAAAALALLCLSASPAAALVTPGAGVLPVHQATSGPERPWVNAKGAELADVTSGQTLWTLSPNAKRPMGSIAKVMTALVVLHAGDLSREITVTRAVIRYVRKDGASSAGLIRGDVLTARELLEAMLLPSGCDAAYMLATAYGPGRAAFLAKMNAMAAQLGMTRTHFTSFDGMPFPTEHSTYSTPHDLVLLGEQAMAQPLFRKIVAQRQYKLRRTALHHRYVWDTTDHLLGSYRGALGIKTGDTKAAGNCLLFAARRDGHTLIGVLLHANPTDNFNATFAAARRILSWGFTGLAG